MAKEIYVNVEQKKDILLGEVDTEADLEGAQKVMAALGLTVGEQYFVYPALEIEPGMSVDEVMGSRYFLTTTREKFEQHREIFEKIAPTVEHSAVVGRGVEKPALWELL